MVVQVNLRVRDTPARVMAVTAGAGDLAPALARLDRQIDSMCLRWRPRPWPDLTRRMLTVGADAVVARRKSVVPERLSPLQAAQVMDAMDYDAHLFIDAETGEDAAVYRAGPSGLRLARQRQVFPPGWSWSSKLSVPPASLVVNSRPAPALDEAAAARRMCAHGLGSLFFTDPTSGRGQLLYPRYDGNLGLVTPVDG
jgi:Sigma 54 modulation/S30EA ribosomal protein C terminus